MGFVRGRRCEEVLEGIGGRYIRGLLGLLEGFFSSFL